MSTHRQAEAALDACIKRIEQDQPCLLLDHEQMVVERVLVLHDEQLASLPRGVGATAALHRERQTFADSGAGGRLAPAMAERGMRISVMAAR